MWCLDIFATNVLGRNKSGLLIEIKIRNKGLKQKKVGSTHRSNPKVIINS